MAKTTKKPAVKAAPKTAKFKFNKKTKIYFLLALAIVATSAGIFVLNNKPNYLTQINTPVIARTELSKKSTIDIKVFDENIPSEIKMEDAETPENTQTEVKENTPVVTTDNNLVNTITELEVKQTKLEEQVTKLAQESNTEEITKINAKLTKLESLNGNIGNLSKIFLGQQLVLLDNAFKVGGNQNLAITNIHAFAKNVAKNDAVATKLQELLTLTNEQAIITPTALNFYAAELKHVKLATTKIEKQEVAKDANIAEKIKAFLKSFIILRHKDDVTAEQAMWNTNIAELQKAIIFTDFIKVEQILADEKLIKLGGEDFVNFAKLFKTYLTQQQALQATLGAFIEGYNYDY